MEDEESDISTSSGCVRVFMLLYQAVGTNGAPCVESIQQSFLLAPAQRLYQQVYLSLHYEVQCRAFFPSHEDLGGRLEVLQTELVEEFFLEVV